MGIVIEQKDFCYQLKIVVANENRYCYLHCPEVARL